MFTTYFRLEKSRRAYKQFMNIPKITTNKAFGTISHQTLHGYGLIICVSLPPHILYIFTKPK